MSDQDTLDAISALYAAGLSPIDRDYLRRLSLHYDPAGQRWYYQLPDPWRASLEYLGYDADAAFVQLCADWPDPNDGR